MFALGALAVTGFLFDLLGADRPATDLLGAAGVLVLCVAIWLRARHWPSMLFLFVPVARRGWILSTRLPAWRYVILGFVLLFAGAWLSVRKARRALRTDDAAGDGGGEGGGGD